jgi:hypothetical protein
MLDVAAHHVQPAKGVKTGELPLTASRDKGADLLVWAATAMRPGTR